MSTSTSTSVPEWKSKLQNAITENMKKDKDSISYPISTIGPDGNPKTRFVLHRGFVNERRKEDDPSKNSIGEEESGRVGEVLLSTTDVRAPKSQQLSKNPNFELAWWFAPSGDQFRIKGRAYVLGRPDHPTTPAFLAEHGQRLAPPALQKEGEFNWEDERRRIYEKISPTIRASFARPIPGTPLKQSERAGGSGGKDDGDYDPQSWPEELKMDGDKALLEKSYANFALTILEPLEVDWCQLNTQPNQRALYRRDASSGSWTSTAVVP